MVMIVVVILRSFVHDHGARLDSIYLPYAWKVIAHENKSEYGSNFAIYCV